MLSALNTSSSPKTCHWCSENHNHKWRGTPQELLSPYRSNGCPSLHHQQRKHHNFVMPETAFYQLAFAVLTLRVLWGIARASLHQFGVSAVILISGVVVGNVGRPTIPWNSME